MSLRSKSACLLVTVSAVVFVMQSSPAMARKDTIKSILAKMNAMQANLEKLAQANETLKGKVDALLQDKAVLAAQIAQLDLTVKTDKAATAAATQKADQVVAQLATKVAEPKPQFADRALCRMR